MVSDGLRRFVRESNAIEGILRNPTRGELEAHQRFLALETVTVPDLERFVDAVAAAVLRDREGLNVRVGDHFPPPGGYAVRTDLEFLLGQANRGDWSPYRLHCAYETLHPFTDGNGRSGRVLWAWTYARLGRDPFALSFLHSWYYKSLSDSRH